MEEKRVFFGPEDARLEGLYAASGGATGAVISHPYPPMGGTMDNPIVEIMAQTLFANGMATLRFNFRGVGKSMGSFDDGRGEQEDVLAAVSFMEEQGTREILLAGYSFGSWVNAAILPQRKLLPAIFVAPPIHLLAFDFTTLHGKVGFMICGDQDAYCPTGELRSIASEIACTLDIIPGANHFFHARERDLATGINNYARQLGPHA